MHRHSKRSSNGPAPRASLDGDSKCRRHERAFDEHSVVTRVVLAGIGRSAAALSQPIGWLRETKGRVKMKVKHIGVADSSALRSLAKNDGAELKPYALIFDQVVIPGSPLLNPNLSEQMGPSYRVLCDANFLAQSGNAEFTPPMPRKVALSIMGKSDPDYDSCVSQVPEEDLIKYDKTWDEYLKFSNAAKRELFNISSDFEKIMHAERAWGQANARLISIAMRLFHRTDAVYIGDLFRSQIIGNVESPANREDVYRIVVMRFRFRRTHLGMIYSYSRMNSSHNNSFGT